MVIFNGKLMVKCPTCNKNIAPERAEKHKKAAHKQMHTEASSIIVNDKTRGEILGFCYLAIWM